MRLIRRSNRLQPSEALCHRACLDRSQLGNPLLGLLKSLNTPDPQLFVVSAGDEG